MPAMIRNLLSAGILAATAGASAAGPAADAMGRCFVDNTTEADRIVLVQWIGTAMAAHPSVAQVMTADEEIMPQIDQALAALFERLMVEDCNDIIRVAVAAEGPDVFFSAGEYLGQIAMQGLMTHPTVNARIEAFATHLDQDRIDEAFR